MLSKEDYQVRFATSGAFALNAVKQACPDLILLDVKMPQMDGFEVCKRLKANEKTKDIPIIFLTVAKGRHEKVKGFSMGAVDYITKPFSPEEVLVRIKTHLQMRHMQVQLESTLGNVQQQVREQNEELIKTNKTLQERLQFEHLISDLSATFINIPSDQIDEKIENGLHLIVESLSVERSAFFEYSETESTLKSNHTWTVDDRYQISSEVDFGKEFPWALNTLLKGEFVNFATIKNLPKIATKDKVSLKKWKVKSSIVVPLKVGGKIVAALSVGTFSYEKKWENKLFPRLKLIGEIFANALHRRRTEEELKEKENQYRTLFESAGEGIFTMKDEKFIDCNQKILEMFGCIKKQIIEQTPWDFSPITQPVGKSSKKEALKKINSALAGQPQFFEWQHKKLDGTLFDVEVTLNRIELRTGTHIQAICRDVTERKRAEEAFKESEARFSAFMEYLPTAVFIKDEKSRNIFLNSYMNEFFGADESWIGKTTTEVLPAKIAKQMQADDRKALECNLNIYFSQESRYKLA